ncbi:MAG: MBL fold metallo-hydrolase [Deltaproteobacteria bacterium]|jgi:glyoxylase-like metal-dependent hydrolase (beta-lactamase superfamily II)|nr:MBL fold metallo-hydrolase [Deltaproteobacteria bacterium]MBT4268399.1 MBL fold metallo-hydrolase [Deltaproteobacteria bacterium]MBT4637686.1 MBL fold metallo-hydrolase [Deltaproteobacteria bacterium]MBT6503928.1 MBL fold metallo-hydrolase [Deltaproteobacteria bacterium]MBT6613540.1 MBL fold metallo-hydrolase [Deltaproteobacteria bacterium]
MLKEQVEIIRKGDQSGNGMVFKVKTPGGLEVYGLATENFYGGNWDLGPTWNYLVLADAPFLVDTGRTGTSNALLGMIEDTGFPVQSLKWVVLSHGHEDHDGGLAEIVALTGAKVKAHPVYERLIRLCPEKVPDGIRKNFPPSCWHCVMPDSFANENCLDYHQNRHELVIENICGQDDTIGKNIRTMYLPGHSPDAIAIILANDIAIVGDNLLPHISPAPSKKESFNLVSEIFSVNQSEIRQAFGLEAYIKTLKRLKSLGQNHQDLLVLPGHRLFYYDQWNDFPMEARAGEIIDHHIERCGAILKILSDSPKTIKEIMTDHFEPSLLKGMGAYMAKNEIQSHLELLLDCMDIEQVNDGRYATTDNNYFESYIQSLEPWQR